MIDFPLENVDFHYHISFSEGKYSLERHTHKIVQNAFKAWIKHVSLSHTTGSVDIWTEDAASFPSWDSSSSWGSCPSGTWRTSDISGKCKFKSVEPNFRNMDIFPNEKGPKSDCKDTASKLHAHHAHRLPHGLPHRLAHSLSHWHTAGLSHWHPRRHAHSHVGHLRQHNQNEGELLPPRTFWAHDHAHVALHVHVHAQSHASVWWHASALHAPTWSVAHSQDAQAARAHGNSVIIFWIPFPYFKGFGMAWELVSHPMSHLCRQGTISLHGQRGFYSPHYFCSGLRCEVMEGARVGAANSNE